MLQKLAGFRNVQVKKGIFQPAFWFIVKTCWTLERMWILFRLAAIKMAFPCQGQVEK